MVIDFGFNDGKVVIGSAIVTFWDGGWKSEIRNVTAQPSRTMKSGWVIGVEGVYGWDAVEFDRMMETTMSAGPFNVIVKRDAKNAIADMRASFVGAE